jgi:hypothetical protein
MFTVEQGKLLNSECARALGALLKKVPNNESHRHAHFVMSNCKIALQYLQHIHKIAIETYPPIAVSLCRTYYEIVCSTIYLAKNEAELDDFLNFGRLMYYESGQQASLPGKLLNGMGVSDLEDLRKYFQAKKEKYGKKGSNQLSWHGMHIVELGKAVDLEKFCNESEAKVRRSHYGRASKLVHGDSLTSLMAYNFDEFGIEPRPYAPPMDMFRVDAMAMVCGWFLVMIASVGEALRIDFIREYDRLNAVWRQIWEDSTGVKVTTEFD